MSGALLDMFDSSGDILAEALLDMFDQQTKRINRTEQGSHL